MSNCNLNNLTMEQMRTKHNNGISLRHKTFKNVKKNNPHLSDIRNAYLTEAVLESENVNGLLHENPQTLGHHMYRTVDGKELKDPISVYFMEPSEIGYKILYTSTDFNLIDDFSKKSTKGKASLVEVNKKTGDVMVGEYKGRSSYSPNKLDLTFNALQKHMDKFNAEPVEKNKVGTQTEMNFEAETFNSESGATVEFNAKNTEQISAELINDIDQANQVFNSLLAGSDIEITPEHEAMLRNTLKDVVGGIKDVLPDMVQFINKNATTNYGKIVMKDQEGKNGLKKGIYIGSTTELKTAGNQKSPAEMYVHELRHAAFEFALRDNPQEVAESMQDIQQVYRLFLEKVTEEDFMPSLDKSINRSLERDIAKARIEYLRDPKVGLHEFMAMHDTDIVVKNVLENKVSISQEKRAPGKNLFEKLVNAVKIVWDFVVQFVRQNKNNIDGLSAMNKFMTEITTINNQAIRKVEEQNIVLKTADNIQKFMNTKGSDYLKKLAKGIRNKTFSDDPAIQKEEIEKALKSHLNDMDKLNSKSTSKLIKPWYFAKAFKYIVSDAIFNKEEHAAGRFEEFLSTALPSFGLGTDENGVSKLLSPEGTVNQIIRAFRDSDKVETDIEKLGLFSNKVDMETETDMHSQADLINALFAEGLSKEENAALVYGMADTDLISLFSEDLDWTEDQKIEHIKQALGSDKDLDNLIEEVETQLSTIITNKNEYEVVMNQAKGLGKRMIKGTSSFGQFTNAYMIYGTKNGTLTKSKIINTNKQPGAKEAIAFIDQLATLHSLKHVDAKVKERTLGLLNKDRDAFINLMKYDMSIQDYMREFDATGIDYEYDITRIKGEHEKIGSSYINKRVDLLSNEKEMEEDNYILAKGLSENSKYGVYINRSYTEPGWKANGVSMTNDGQSFNSYINIFKAENLKGKEDELFDEAARKKEKIEVEAELKNMEKKVKEELLRMRNPNYIAKESGMRPIFSTNKSGELYVTDMDININRQKVEHKLETKITISSVISKSTAKAASIFKSKQNNLRILDLAESDAMDNYEYDRDYHLGGKKNAMAYMRVGPDEGFKDEINGKPNAQSRSQQIWNILPRYMKLEITKRHALNTNRDIVGYMHSAGLNNTDGIHSKKFYTQKAQDLQAQLDTALKEKTKDLKKIKGLYKSLSLEISNNVLIQSKKDLGDGKKKSVAIDAMNKIKEIRGRQPYIPVRRNLVRNYFGNRELVFFGNRGSSALFPVVGHKGIISVGMKMMKYLDMLWRHIIKITKADMVVRNLAVLGMNILSNVLLGVLQGKNPFTEIKMQIQGIRMLHSYIEDNKNVKRLELKLKAGTHTDEDVKKLKRLKNNIANNPAKPLIDAGLYTATGEDLTNVDLHKAGYLDEKFDAAGNKIPSKLRDAMKFIYMTKDTAPFKILLLSMQYSDFAARYSTYYTLKGKGVPLHVIEKKVLDNQINYNFGHGELLQWLNDRGFVMFTMFYERIQRVLKNTTIEQPFNVLAAVFLGDFVYDNSPFGDSVFERSPNFTSPLDILDKQMELIPIMASFK